jgi:hypothetical protein
MVNGEHFTESLGKEKRKKNVSLHLSFIRKVINGEHFTNNLEEEKRKDKFSLHLLECMSLIRIEFSYVYLSSLIFR